MKGFLEYTDGDSVLHRMNPVVKLLCAFVLCFACFCTSNLAFLATLLMAFLALAASCGMAGRVASLVRAVAAFSLVLAVVQILTTPGGTALLDLPWGAVGTAGLLAALTTVVRLCAAAIPLFLTFYVTRIVDMSNALVKNAHVPYRYAFAFASTVRFIPMFMNDMAAIMEAQTARGVRFDQAGILQKVRLTVPLCVPLLVTSVRKANSAAIAAEVRGFDLRGRGSGYREYPIAARDAAAIGACLLVLLAAVALSLM